MPRSLSLSLSPPLPLSLSLSLSLSLLRGFDTHLQDTEYYQYLSLIHI